MLARGGRCITSTRTNNEGDAGEDILKMAASRGFMRELRNCVAYDKEMKKIAKLAVPYTFHAVVVDVIELVEIAVISHIFAQKNSTIIGAYMALELVFSLVTMLPDGALESLTILCSHAVGARDYALAGKYVQLAVFAYLAVFVPFAVLAWNCIDDIVLWLDFSESVAKQALEYGRIALVCRIVEVFNTSLRHMLKVTGFVWFSTIISIIHAVVAVVLAVLISYKFDNPQLWMVGAVELICEVVFFTICVCIVVCKGWLEGNFGSKLKWFWAGLMTPAICDKQAVRIFFKTALPLSIGYMIEYGEWGLLFLFASAQGPANITAWGLIGWIWVIAEDIAQGMSETAEDRVATFVGSNRPALACCSSHKCLFLGVLTSIFVCVLTLTFQDEITRLLTPDETIQQMIREALPIVCVGLATLSFGNISWSVLCAQGRTKLATAVSFCGSVFITLPLAAISTFVFHFNLSGLVASMVIGYALSGTYNSFLLVTTNWEKVCHKSVRRNENYDDCDWDDLPKEVMEAARILGYSKVIWDKGQTGRYDDYDWDGLPKEAMEAAQILGYSKIIWEKNE